MTKKIKLKKKLKTNILNEKKFSKINTYTDREIAEALIDSYKGSIEYENEDMKDFLIEIQNIKKGLYGKYIEDYCLSYEVDGILACGMFVPIFKGEPTITYQFTRPEYRKQGLASSLILQTENILYKDGYDYLYVYLSLENKDAYNLYDYLNYKEIYK